MTDLHAMLPQNKFETEKAQALVALGYPTVEPILPDLMIWMQDTNWPAAQVIAPFLATIGLPLVPHIRSVFATNDGCWKMRVMRHLVETSPAVFDAVWEEIQQMANMQPQNEDEEALQEVAQEVLEHYGITYQKLSQSPVEVQ